ncbi:MAG: hypothetical protein UW40_C0013G0002 [Parcubacteria group bacterium GW2011_GWF2_44_17]|nr:MAG: hypothetical protein UW40_C0013G0002 [Parcubacteria group bacterium GW2011_GWF2_44_17]HCA66949.1 hypothetical protein [Candidatus Jacksonbacteria bacterium]
MTELFNQKTQTPRRRKLRNNSPKAESILWYRLKGKQLKGYKFRRQYGIGNYIIDFYVPKAKLAIEIDGESHIGKPVEMRDNKRQEFIEFLGISCLRFTNWDVYENIDGVLEEIISYLP